MTGHIKLDRKILSWEWYNDANTFRVFVHLLLMATHKDGKYRGILVKRGQVVTGRLKLATALGLSEMEIRTSLNKLKTTNEITIKATNRYSIITICKYDVYQSFRNLDNQQNNQQSTKLSTNNQPTINQQLTTFNNVNNVKNDNNKEYSEKLPKEAGQAGNDFDFKRLLNPPSFPTWRKEVKEFLSDEYFIQQQSKDKKIKYGEIYELMTKFVYDKNLEGDFKNVAALKKHFGYWVVKHFEHKLNSNTNAMSNGFVDVPMGYDYKSENNITW